jgi:hypothetical protein
MWSIGGAVLVEVVVCITAIAFALRRLHRELEPTVRSLDLFRRDVAGALDLAARDAGRVEASRRLLRGNK